MTVNGVENDSDLCHVLLVTADVINVRSDKSFKFKLDTYAQSLREKSPRGNMRECAVQMSVCCSGVP